MMDKITTLGKTIMFMLYLTISLIILYIVAFTPFIATGRVW